MSCGFAVESSSKAVDWWNFTQELPKYLVIGVKE